MKRTALTNRVLILAVALAPAASPAAAITYVAADLGALPVSSGVAAANDAGQVCGTLANGHAFVYTPGSGALDIGTLRGQALALAINDAGQVAGHANVSGVEHAFLYTPGVGMADIGPCYAATIRMNEAGQVAGIYGADGFIYTPGAGRAYVTGVDAQSDIYGINDLGQVVGAYRSPATGNNYHPFFWDPVSGITDLGTLGGVTGSAWAVNNSGQVAGWSDGSAFLYTPGVGMIAIPGLSVPSGIIGMNSAAQVIGGTGVGSAQRGVVYASGSGWTQLAPLSGFTNSTAYHISDAGYVIGVSTDASGCQHVVRWDPVPEPSSLLALCAGLVSAGAVWRRRGRQF